jgi:hypothetical protein
MKTTIRLDDDLSAEVRQVAAKTNRTMTAVIEDVLRQHFNQQLAIKERQPVRLHTVDGNGLLPGVDLDDSASLLELMEQNNDSV